MTESNLCIFHKESAHLSAKENEQKQNHLDQKIKSNLSQKKPLLLIGYNINDLRFEGEFPTSIYLLHSKINKVDFSNAVFKGVVDFEEALFNIDVNFANAVFKSVTSFIASRLEGEIAIFSKVTFEDAVMFQEAIFNGVAYFNQAFFKGYPNFSRTIFRGRKENFTAPTIKGELPDFSMLLEAGLPKYVAAIFRKATFQEGADFGESHFKGEASFFAATFRGDGVYFADAQFEELGLFSTAIFEVQSRVTFSRAIFKGRGADFGWAAFKGKEIAFDQVNFEGEASFLAATFNAVKINFGRSEFKLGYFKQVRFEGRFIVFHNSVFEEVSFYISIFKGDAVFLEVKFKKFANFCFRQIFGYGNFFRYF